MGAKTYHYPKQGSAQYKLMHLVLVLGAQLLVLGINNLIYSMKLMYKLQSANRVITRGIHLTIRTGPHLWSDQKDREPETPPVQSV